MKKELVRLRHARSKKDFPEITLEEDEYVELAIRRSKIGIFFIWLGVACGFAALTAALILFTSGGLSSPIFKVNDASRPYLYIMIFALYFIVLLVGVVATVTYASNKLYITNKRAFQLSMTSLFSRSVNVIDLVSIEDVSFKQNGLFEHIFQLGTIRMATVGDETTYTFKYINTPRDELDTIIHLVHTVKSKNN